MVGRRHIWLIITAIPLFYGCSDTPLLTDITPESGIDFSYQNHHQPGAFPIYEMTGGGVAAFDVDNDGDLDLLFTQYRHSPPELFINHSHPASGIRFEKSTCPAFNEQSGGQGLAIADVDHNGYLDVYFSNLGQDQLWLNSGGCLENRTPMIQADTGGWSSSAVFSDLDKDGWPDLIVARYTEIRSDTCTNMNSISDYCGPESFADETNLILRNVQGDFFQRDTDFSQTVAHASLGVISMDINRDGYQDLLIANDGDPNELWWNATDGLQERAYMAGMAVNRNGQSEAGMGIGVADIDKDGYEDFIMTHLSSETHTLYRNVGGRSFVDDTIHWGIGTKSATNTGFGVELVDIDMDGNIDLWVANGGVSTMVRDPDVLVNYPQAYGERNQVWRLKNGKFVEQQEWLAVSDKNMSRGLISVDLDNDGDRDIVVTHINDPVTILENHLNPGNWIGLYILNVQGTAALDAHVELWCNQNLVYYGQTRFGASYLSSRDPRITWNSDNCSPNIQVTWADGFQCKIDAARNRQYTTITRPHHSGGACGMH